MDRSHNEQFVTSYIAAWSTQDSDQRRRLIDQLYAEDAEFYAEERDDDPVQCRGRAEIMENITQVNQRLTQGAGLVTESTGSVENHDLLRVSWKMIAPDGTLAMTGMNLLLRNSKGEIARDYILIG